MSPVATFIDSGMSSLSQADGDSGVGGGNIHQSEDLILALFLSRDSCASSCLGRSGMGVRFYVNPRLISGECLTLNQFVLETHGIWNWYPPPPDEYICYS